MNLFHHPYIKLLFIIEAPGKEPLLSAILNSLQVDRYSIAATKGRLFDYTPQSINHSSIYSVPVYSPTLRLIRDAAKDSSDVILLTDDDVEGEVIAADVRELLSDLDCNIFRARLNRLEESTVCASLQNLDLIEEEKVNCGRSRRLLDATLGVLIPKIKNIHRHSIGRVITPLLGSLQSKLSLEPVAYISKRIEHGQSPPAYAVATVPMSAQDKIQALKKDLAALPSTTTLQASSLTTLPLSPWNYGELLLNVCRHTGLSVNAAAQTIQHMYHCGKISYARSDSHTLSDGDKQRIVNALTTQDASDANERLTEAGTRITDHSFPRQQSGHSAVVPLSLITPEHSNENTSIDRKIIELMKDHLINIASPHRLITYESNKNALELQALVKKYKPHSIPIKICQLSPLNPNFNANLYPEFGHSEKIEDPRVTLLSVDAVALSLILKSQLTRPSMLLHFTNKLVKKYLNDRYELNRRAKSDYDKGVELFPALNSPATVEAINVLANDPKCPDITARYKELLEILDIDTVSPDVLTGQLDTQGRGSYNI